MKTYLSFLLPALVKERKFSIEPTKKIISSTLLIFLLIFSLTIYLANSDAHALPIPFGHSNVRGLPTSPTNHGGLNNGALQYHSGGTLSDLRQNSGVSGPEGLHTTNTITNCASSNSKLPSDSTRNCVGSSVVRPANSNFVTQPNNCNIPTTTNHNFGQSNVVVHPNNCPNTTIVHPTNCNIPTMVRHTNSSTSNTVIRPTDCPPTATSTSNSLTINTIRGTTSGGQNTNTGLYGYLYPGTNQNIITPIADAGANQVVSSYSYVTLDGSASYDPNGGSLGFSWMQVGGNPVTLSSFSIANPVFITPIVIYPATLTFQLIVNNGEASSAPSYVYITVQP